MLSQGVVLPFDVFGMTSRCGSTCDAVGRPAFRVVLETWRAATGTGIASNLPNLCRVVSVVHIGSTCRAAGSVGTLQRSQACPVREAPESLVLTAPEKSPFSVRAILFATGVPSCESFGRLVEGIFRRSLGLEAVEVESTASSLDATCTCNNKAKNRGESPTRGL